MSPQRRFTRLRFWATEDYIPKYPFPQLGTIAERAATLLGHCSREKIECIADHVDWMIDDFLTTHDNPASNRAESEMDLAEPTLATLKRCFTKYEIDDEIYGAIPPESWFAVLALEYLNESLGWLEWTPQMEVSKFDEHCNRIDAIAQRVAANKGEQYIPPPRETTRRSILAGFQNQVPNDERLTRLRYASSGEAALHAMDSICFAEECRLDRENVFVNSLWEKRFADLEQELGVTIEKQVTEKKSQQARKAARSRHKNAYELQDFAVAMYTGRKWQSRLQASREIFPEVQKIAREMNCPMSELTGPQTVYKWLSNYERQIGRLRGDA